ncbi:MAG: S16 family serine protease, partial [Chthoniobacteraceae bacterium]
AAIQDIALDPLVAVTGDLTVDGSVQPVGGVIEKLRAAIAGQCAITLIPKDNARDAADLALLDGTETLWETQIFSISTIDQALAMARQDRTQETGDAIARFAALRARLPAVVTPNYLQSPVVRTELKEVLRAAPNHLSAETLLRAAENTLPPTLSLRRSIEEILATSNFFVGDVINPSKAAPKESQGSGLTVFPEREFAECMSKLQRLTGILDRRAMELKSTCTAYAGALRASLTYQTPDLNALRTRQQWSDVAHREKSFLQQIKADLDDTRSRLLLALHKIDVDGSLKSESTKK